jgi:hypothetical protein
VSVPVVFAHETWFTDGRFPLDWGFAGETLTLALLAAALLVTLAVRAISRLWPGVDVPALGRLAPWMPFAVRIHLAVSLVGLLSMGVYLSPAMDLQPDLAGIALGATMAVVVIHMATGFYARHAAALLVAAGPLGMLEFVRAAGAVEVLFGLLLISGALPQVCVLVAGIPFNATLWFFGTDELLGHLPVYAAMLVLLVFGSDPTLRPAVSALWPFGRLAWRPRMLAAEG